jgi:hypothetical protein
MIRDVYSGSGSWFFTPCRIPDPGVKKAPDPGSASLILPHDGETLLEGEILEHVDESKIAERQPRTKKILINHVSRRQEKHLLLTNGTNRLPRVEVVCPARLCPLGGPGIIRVLRLSFLHICRAKHGGGVAAAHRLQHEGPVRRLLHLESGKNTEKSWLDCERYHTLLKRNWKA